MRYAIYSHKPATIPSPKTGGGDGGGGSDGGDKDGEDGKTGSQEGKEVGEKRKLGDMDKSRIVYAVGAG